MHYLQIEQNNGAELRHGRILILWNNDTAESRNCGIQTLRNCNIEEYWHGGITTAEL